MYSKVFNYILKVIDHNPDWNDWIETRGLNHSSGKKMSKYLKSHCVPCVIAHHVFCTCGSWPYGLVPWKRKLPNILKTFEIQYNVTHIYSRFLYYGAWNCVKYMTQRNPPPPEKRKDTISWKHLISSTLNKKHFKFTPCVTVHQIIKWYVHVGYAPFERHWLFRTGNNHNVYHSCVKFDLSG